MDTKFPVS